MKAARTWIHCGDQLKFGRKFGMTGGTGNMDAAGFQRFTQGFQQSLKFVGAAAKALGIEL